MTIPAHQLSKTDLLNKCAIEQEALNYFLQIMDLTEALKDPLQTTYVTMKGCDSLFWLKPYGQEEFNYWIHLSCRLSEKSGAPLIHAFLLAKGPNSNGLLYLSKDAAFGIRSVENPRLKVPFLNDYYESESGPLKILGSKRVFIKSVTPKKLGMSRMTAGMLIRMDYSISAGMARNITTESYDFDFSMDDQAATSGLSL